MIVRMVRSPSIARSKNRDPSRQEYDNICLPVSLKQLSNEVAASDGVSEANLNATEASSPSHLLIVTSAETSVKARHEQTADWGICNGSRSCRSSKFGRRASRGHQTTRRCELADQSAILEWDQLAVSDEGCPARDTLEYRLECQRISCCCLRDLRSSYAAGRPI